jgi:hypothetical protein
VWNPPQGTLRIWSHSNRYRELFEELFARAWGLRLVPQAPFTLALDGAKDPEASAAALLEVVPANLVEVLE